MFVLADAVRHVSTARHFLARVVNSYYFLRCAVSYHGHNLYAIFACACNINMDCTGYRYSSQQTIHLIRVFNYGTRSAVVHAHGTLALNPDKFSDLWEPRTSVIELNILKTHTRPRDHYLCECLERHMSRPGLQLGLTHRCAGTRVKYLGRCGRTPRLHHQISMPIDQQPSFLLHVYTTGT